MIRKYVLCLQLIFCFSALSAQERPNVLFIAIDDLNDYVNCMNGSIKILTPNIDRLAEMGTLFTNAHCQAPICGPSRASVMTGLYPSTSGNYLQLNDIDIKKGSQMAGKATFMPDYFERYGYKTMAVGKIYHNGDRAETFDEYGGRFDWFGPKPEKRFHYDPSKMPDKKGNTQTDWGAYPTHDSMMSDFKVARWTVQKLQEDHDQPFFLAAGFLRPHVPWYVPQKWFDRFPLDEIEVPPYKKDDYDDIPLLSQKVNRAPMMPTTEELIASGEWKEVIQAYMACVAFVDAQVGKVLDALENSRYSDNTIIVLWTDHGYHLGEKNRFAKQSLWERSSRVTLIFKSLHHNAGQKCYAPVELIDIYPTLIDLCNLPELSRLEGRSLTPLLSAPRNTDYMPPARTFYGEGNIAIRDERFRLIRYEDGSMELYDMINDPNEWNNLADHGEYKTKIKELAEHVPGNWAPLSEYSRYNFNEYFIEKSNGN